jgi:hydroxylamine reductase (hybrid-cluster protein)
MWKVVWMRPLFDYLINVARPVDILGLLSHQLGNEICELPIVAILQRFEQEIGMVFDA